MKYIKKICLILLMSVLILNSVVFSEETSLEESIPDINTDGSQSSAVWFHVFDSLLNDKVTNGVKFFLILSSLRYNSIELKLNQVLNKDESRKTLLAKYGLNSNSIYFIMNYYMSTFPENIDDIKYNYVFGENIYADLFHDRNFDYSKYMLRFHNYLNELFRQLPYEMQMLITKYDRKQAGEIVVMQGLMNIVISDYIAFETYNSVSNATIARSLHLRDNIKQPLINELIKVANDYPEDYVGDTSIDNAEIEEYVDAFVSLGNVILESIEMNLNDNGLMKYAIELSKDTNLLVRTPYSPSAEQVFIDITLRMNTEFVELDSSVTLSPGYINEFQLVPYVQGSNAKVKYTIDDPTVATVSDSGLITLSSKKQGLARITATVENYNVFKEIIVQVTEESPQGAISFYGPYISGYPDGTFAVQKDITRAEIATMMIRVLRLDVALSGMPVILDADDLPSYTDVSKDNWAYKYIELSKKHHILSGYDDGTFRPNSKVTRAEMAIVIANSWQALGIEQSELATHFIRDVDVDHWAFNAINKLYNAKVVIGYDDGTFRPDDFTNRGEIVVMINSIINRKSQKPVQASFIDVLTDHWAYGFVEAATKIQVIQQDLDDQK